MAQIIVFDFDGTLVDTKRAYVEMMAQAFAKFNIKIKSEEVARTLVPTIKGTIERLLMRYKDYQAQMVHKLELTTIELLSSRWIEHVKIDSSIIELLDALSENDNTLYLASNSHSSFVLPTVKKFKLKKYFKDIVTLDSGYKSKSDMLKALAKKSKRPVRELRYIGDTIMDVEMAEELGCELIILLTPSSWDYDKKRKLIKAAAGKPRVRVVKNIKDAETALLGV